jgi:putative phosphoesterase
MLRIGIVSDTHGLLRPSVLAFLQGCDHIVHGGDVGSKEILDTLRGIAPLTAVRGNNDSGSWASDLAQTQRVTIEGVTLYVLHDLAQLAIDPRAEGIDVVVSGHSHRPTQVQREGVLYFNPGSCGRRRFRLPIAVGQLLVTDRRIDAHIEELAD